MKIVRSTDEILSLARDRRVNGLVAREAIAFDIPVLSRRRQNRAERALNRYQRRCGCSAGAVCFLAALVAGGVYVARAEEALSIAVAVPIVGVLAASFASGLLAKIAVLAFTRLEFAVACRRLWRELSEIALEGAADMQAEG